jgi:hypothetical protein
MPSRKSKQPEREPIGPLEPRIFDATVDYEIILEEYRSDRSRTGMDTGYGIRNKRTGSVEMRFGAYAEAMSWMMILQSKLDEQMVLFHQTQGTLN